MWRGSCASYKWKDWTDDCSYTTKKKQKWTLADRAARPPASRLATLVDESDDAKEDEIDASTDDEDIPLPAPPSKPPRRGPKGPLPPPPRGAIPPLGAGPLIKA